VSTTTPDKCPKCGADFLSSSFGMTTFYCGSRNSYPTQHPGWLQESAFCLRHQRDQLAEKVRRLEEAGDRMAAELNRQCAPHWEDSLARLWRTAKTGGRPADQAEASACAVIQDGRQGES